MATILKEVDAVVIGVGWTGSIMARELTKAGLTVVGLERGPKRSPREDFAIPSLRGQKIAGGNMFEGPRQNEYPNKPLVQPLAGSIMAEACKSLGYNTFSAPSANSSDVYVNPEGLTLGACEYCGHCERFGCEAN